MKERAAQPGGPFGSLAFSVAKEKTLVSNPNPLYDLSRG